ncbi:hypothetical protein SBADM41S_06900 [Streptomyces badius]
MSDALVAALEKQEEIGGEVAAQGSLTALVQTHALVVQQPKPDFSDIDNMKRSGNFRVRFRVHWINRQKIRKIAY